MAISTIHTSKIRPAFDGESTNVLDIPKYKSFAATGRRPTEHSGVVDIKCVINRLCPFVKTEFVNQTYVLNAQSIRNWPEDMRNQIDTVIGLEGIFLKESVVYRHTYLDAKEKGGRGIDRLEDNQVSSIAGTKSYRREQRFLIKPGLFDNSMLRPAEYASQGKDSGTTCEQLPRWTYDTLSVADDLHADTKEFKILMPTVISNTTCSNKGIHWRAEKQTPLFAGEDFFIQFHKLAISPDVPAKTVLAIQDAQAAGGQIDDARFAGRAEAKFKQDYYRPLDVTYNEKQPLTDACGQKVYLYKNEGVVSHDKDGRPISGHVYDFRFKPYLIVEIGIPADEQTPAPLASDSDTSYFQNSANPFNSPFNSSIPDTQNRSAANVNIRDRYFIIIANKAPIKMIRIGSPLMGASSLGLDPLSNSSTVVSTFEEARVIRNNQSSSGSLSGEQLMEAKWFRMHVRNHLGSLVVQFITDSWKSNHWIINRTDNWYVNTGSIEKRAVPIFIPEGKIALWGGNMRSGFLFGPLHYHSPDKGKSPLVFDFPPQSFVAQATSQCGKVNSPEPDEPGGNEDEGRGGELSESQPDPPPQPETDDVARAYSPYDTVSLPSGVPHRILLTAADDHVAKLSGYTKKVYTQDAQIFKYWNEGIKTDLGSFYKGPPYKALDSRGKDQYSYLKLSKVNTGKNDTVQKDTKGRADLFRIRVEMNPGGHRFSTQESKNFQDGDGSVVWDLDNVKTPILTMFRLVADPIDTTRWSARGVDVSDNILQYSDSWAAQNFVKIDHTGSIQFLINEGADFNNNQTDYITSLVNKTFYIEVWGGYKDLSQDNQSLPDTVSAGCNYSKIPGYYKLFTGLCYGGSVTGEPGKRTMECQIFDYNKPLEHMLFFNGPFFDGVRDVNAVNEVMRTAGFKETQGEDPGVLIAAFANKASAQHLYKAISPDGRPSICQPMALPNAYNKLAQPYFKPKDGSKLLDTILGMAKKTGKCFFFDSYGVAHYESYYDYSVLGVIAGIDNELLTGEKQPCVETEDGTGTTTVTGDAAAAAAARGPAPAPSPSHTRISPDQLALWWYTTNPNRYVGQLAYDAVKGLRAVQDVYNHTKIMTSTPNFEILIGDNLDWDSTDQPAKQGFIGYRKTIYQQDGIFGSEEALRKITEFYESMRNPPLVVNFSSFGLPVRTLDIVYFDGQPLRVMKVDTTIDPKDNKWMNNLECEWLFPIEFNPQVKACAPEPTTPTVTE
jgi:hypothetical protein